MPAGNHGELLLWVADALCSELPDLETTGDSDLGWIFGDQKVMAKLLSPEEETLVEGLRTALARIAAALGATPESPQARMIEAALEGAEMVTRGELLIGNAEQLPRLMPSMVFLVALPIVDQSSALELSRRTAQLITKRLRDAGR